MGSDVALRELMKLVPRYKVSLGQVLEWGSQAPRSHPARLKSLSAGSAAKPRAGMGPAFRSQRSAGINNGSSGLNSWGPLSPPALTCSVDFIKIFPFLVPQLPNLLLHALQSCFRMSEIISSKHLGRVVGRDQVKVYIIMAAVNSSICKGMQK